MPRALDHGIDCGNCSSLPKKEWNEKENSNCHMYYSSF